MIIEVCKKREIPVKYLIFNKIINKILANFVSVSAIPSFKVSEGILS